MFSNNFSNIEFIREIISVKLLFLWPMVIARILGFEVLNMASNSRARARAPLLLSNLDTLRFPEFYSP